MQNELKSVILSFGILLILGISLTSFQQSFSQTTKFTDANYDEFHFNPDSYLANPINITGKIFNTITPSGGYGSFQLYQLGNSERLLYVGYNINIHQNFRDDECVRVMGNTVGSISYTNLFGAERSSPSVLATSIQKIDCKDMVNPNSKIVNIEQTQEKDGILFTLHKVEFADDKTRAFLSIENTNTDEDDELSFYPLSDSKEIQGKKQFETKYSFDEDSISSSIPPGIEETGVVAFEPLDKNLDAKFEFAVSKYFDESKFRFEVSNQQ